MLLTTSMQKNPEYAGVDVRPIRSPHGVHLLDTSPDFVGKALQLVGTLPADQQDDVGSEGGPHDHVGRELRARRLHQQPRWPLPLLRMNTVSTSDL